MKKLYFFLFVLLYSCQPAKQSNPYLSSTAGYVDVKGGQVWYGVLGEGEKAPYLYLHGGPGGTSRGGLQLVDLTEDRPLIIIDQLGSGFSTNHTDTTLLTVKNFVEQVKAVKEALNLNEFYIFGTSWGTALSLEYYSAYPDGVKGIVFGSPYFSTPTWVEDTDILAATLPDSIQQAINVAEETNTFDTQSYRDAEKFFSKHFFIRTERQGDPVKYDIFGSPFDTLEHNWSSFIYNYMWGPSEFSPTGTLLDYDNIKSLSNVSTPVLFITGEYDTARPETVKKYTEMVQQAEYIEIPGAGHVIIVDNKPKVLEALRNFANNVDKD